MSKPAGSKLKYLALAALLFSACSGAAAALTAEQFDAKVNEFVDDQGHLPERGANLLVWESREERPFLEEKLKQFAEKYQISYEFAEVGAADSVTKMMSDGPSGIGADLFVFPHDNLPRAVESGVVRPLDGDDAEYASAYTLQPALQAVTYKGKRYGYPARGETYAMFYNRKLVKTPPKTFDEVIKFAKTFNKPAQKKFAFMWDVGNFYFSYPFFSSLGGFVYGNNGSNPAVIGLNHAGAISGLTLMRNLRTSILPLKSNEINWDFKTELFKSGKLAMNIDGPWSIASFEGRVDFAVAPFPALKPGKPAKTFHGVKAYYASTFTKYPTAVSMLIRELTTKEAMVEGAMINRTVPLHKQALDVPAFKKNLIDSGFYHQFRNSEPLPAIQEMGNVWGPAGMSLGEIWNARSDVKKTLDTTVRHIRDANKIFAK